MENETFKEKLYYFWKFNFTDRYWSCRNWLKQHLRKRFINIIKVCLNSYPWDYSYLYQIEEAKLKEMLNYHENSHIVCEESRQQKIKTLKLALKMLYIIQNKSDYFDYDGETKWIELDEKDENGENLYHWDTSGLVYTLKCKVNTRNYQRFNLTKNIVELHPHEVYLEKARYLYHKIRLNYEQIWWD